MDRNIDPRFRKPRQTRGTPLHLTRHFYILSTLLVSGLTWVAFELWPQTKKLKKDIMEGKFEQSEHWKQRVDLIRLNNQSPQLGRVFSTVQAKLEEKKNREEEPQPQSTLSKVVSSFSTK